MEPQKQFYTLFIFGNFKGKSAEGEILQPLIPITCNESLKYIYEPFVMIVQFDTDIPEEELVEYVKTTYKSSEVQYYLVPKGEEVAVDLPKKVKENLMELENNSDRVNHIRTHYDVKQDADAFDKFIQMFMDSDESIGQFIDEEDGDPMLVPQENIPTLNDLLDKMIDGETLSLSEKELLTRYSNEYK